jgi:hypothetical protein
MCLWLFISDRQDVAQNVRHLKEKLSHGEFSALQEIRHALLELVAPTDLVGYNIVVKSYLLQLFFQLASLIS